MATLAAAALGRAGAATAAEGLAAGSLSSFGELGGFVGVVDGGVLFRVLLVYE